MELNNYLQSRDFIFFICTGAIASQVIAITDSITRTCIMPYIKKKMNKDNNTNNTNNNIIKDQEEKYKDKEEFKNIEIDYEELMVAIIRLIITIMVLNILYKILV